MAGAQAIGSLYVALGMDSAAFSEGVKRVQSVTSGLQESFAKFGAKATSMGKSLSVVTGAMAAVGGAASALVIKMSSIGKEISMQSQLANAGTTEFQRWAAGAKTVGIENDKLSDILKDVNDRVGEFVSTGGGPMKDFFDNVAPKVGVTADAFKDLSGPQALQLFVSSLEKAGLSQQEMTFYMEAMASDSTALIPLLQNSGSAMQAYGDAAERAGAVMSDSAIASSVEFQQKLTALQQAIFGASSSLSSSLLPIVNQFMDILLAKGVPAMQAAVTKIGEMIQWFGSLPEAVQQAAAVIATVLGVGGPVLLALGALSTGFAALIAATGPVGLFIAAAAVAYTAWQIWGDDIKAAVGGALDWVSQRFTEVVTFIQGIPAQLYEIGQNIIQGLIDGIKAKFEEFKETVASMVDWMPDWVREKLGIHSPSTVFQEIGQFITQGLSLGITEGKSGVQAAMDGIADTTKNVDLSSGVNEFASDTKSAFQSIIDGSKSVKEALADLASSWLSSTASGLLSSGISDLGTAIGIPGFANGTNNFAGGIAQINERGGEIVDLPSGTRIIPHDVSNRMADGVGASYGAQLGATSMTITDDGTIMAQVSAQVVQMGQAVAKNVPNQIKSYNANPRKR